MTTPNAYEDVEQQDSPSLMGIQNITTTLEDSLAVLTKLHILFIYDPVNVLFDIYPKELRTMCTQNLAYGYLQQFYSKLH